MSLYGPFPVMAYNADGSLSTSPAAGIHYTADAPTYAAHSALLTPYRVLPVHPLQFVMAGDDPANPTNSFAIVFPDQTTATSTMAQLAGS